jgi:hypothetical protein
MLQERISGKEKKKMWLTYSQRHIGGFGEEGSDRIRRSDRSIFSCLWVVDQVTYLFQLITKCVKHGGI